MDKHAIVYHEGIAEYDFGEEYSLRGDRFPRYLHLLESENVLDRFGIDLLVPEPAKNVDLGLVHTVDYISNVEEIASNHGNLSDDTPITPSIVKAVRLIVGAALMAGDAVAGKGYAIAQGVGGGLHHAGRDYGEGWCVFNDVAVCARAMTQRYGLDRVLIFDTDAHAGNGTMDIFYSDPKVLYLTIHQDPMTLYPNTGFPEQIGEGDGRGYTINIPLPRRADDSCMALVLEKVFKPIVRQFKPQVIIRNGGADPHYQDELAELGLTYKGLYSIGQAVTEASEKVNCGLVDLLCGGYSQGREEKGLYAIFSGEYGVPLTQKEDEPPPSHDPSVLPKTEAVINQLSDLLVDYWEIEKIK